MNEVPGITLASAALRVHETHNSQYPDVFIGKLTAEARQAIVQGKPVNLVKLGVPGEENVIVPLTEASLASFRSDLIKNASDAFMLMWDGDKIPRGAELNGYRIGWTQNGEVVSDKGELIGLYDRLMESGGQSGIEQQMLVFFTAQPKVT